MWVLHKYWNMTFHLVLSFWNLQFAWVDCFFVGLIFCVQVKQVLHSTLPWHQCYRDRASHGHTILFGDEKSFGEFMLLVFGFQDQVIAAGLHLVLLRSFICIVWCFRWEGDKEAGIVENKYGMLVLLQWFCSSMKTEKELSE